jgi:hypothetical protein
VYNNNFPYFFTVFRLFGRLYFLKVETVVCTGAPFVQFFIIPHSSNEQKALIAAATHSPMEEFVPPDILAMLAPQVEVDAEAERRTRNEPHAEYNSQGAPLDNFRHTGSEDGDEYVDLLKNVYQDQHALNYAQKEKVATKILKGEYNISQKYEPASGQNGQYDPFQHQAHSNAVMRRHQLNHSFINLTSGPVSFADPAAKKAAALSRNKQLGRGEQLFVSQGRPVPAVPLHVPLHREKQRASFPSRTEIVS